MSKTSVTAKNSKKQNNKRIPKKITQSYLHNAGLYYLERYAASSAHFRFIMMRKIIRSCACHEDQNKDECVLLLNELIKKFENTGLLNDEVYARGMVSSLRRKGLSKRMIQNKLKVKGVEEFLINEAIAEHDKALPQDPEIIAALKLIRRKRIGSYSNKDIDDALFKKWMGTLARSGYSYELSKKILSMDKDEAESLVDLR